MHAPRTAGAGFDALGRGLLRGQGPRSFPGHHRGLILWQQPLPARAPLSCSAIPRHGSAATETGPWCRRTLPIAVAVAALLSLPSLFIGFVHDDCVYRILLEGEARVHGPPWLDLYDFTPPGLDRRVLVDSGRLPWFTDPGFSLRFLRPLASLLMLLEHELFGRNALALHVHSMAWLLAMVALATRLYQRWFSPGAARLCALVFACSGVFTMPTAWIAARHALVAATLGGGALLGWIRYREDHWKPGLVMALVALVASLAASEAGLATIVFLCAYEIGRRGLRQGLRGALGMLALGGAYLLAYALLGYGARGSSMYTSPFEAPVRYGLVVLGRVPLLCGELFAAVPSMFAAIDQGVHVALAALGVAALAAIVAILFWGRRTLDADVRRHLVWLGSASLASLPAMVGAMGAGRALGLCMLGAAPLVAHALLVLLKARASGTSLRRWSLAVPVAWLLAAHFGMSPLQRIGLSVGFVLGAELQRMAAITADLGDCARDGDIYLVGGPEARIGNPAFTLPFHRGERALLGRVHMLSLSPRPQRLYGIDSSSFELEVLGGDRNPTVSEQVYRPTERPLQPGMVFEYKAFRVEIVDSAGGLLKRAHFTISPGGPEHRSCLLAWRDGRLQPLAMPTAGATVEVPVEVGPYGF
jgi:hypothetical protein